MLVVLFCLFLFLFFVVVLFFERNDSGRKYEDTLLGRTYTDDCFTHFLLKMKKKSCHILQTLDGQCKKILVLKNSSQKMRNFSKHYYQRSQSFTSAIYK